MARKLQFIPYPSIGRHGVTGDRRTACLTAADGTIDWLCLPDYDGPPIFGALLDVERGGFFRLGPTVPFTGSQRYLDHTPVVVTEWKSAAGTVELHDVMIDPQNDRPKDEEGRRVVVRMLRCTSGKQSCRLNLSPRDNFGPAPKSVMAPNGVTFEFGHQTVGVWAPFPLHIDGNDVVADFDLCAGDEVWVVVSLGEQPSDWSVERARQAYERTRQYWEGWLGHIHDAGKRERQLQHSGLILHLMGYAPCGSLVAAPTTSLPERIGGGLNWDYRYAWIRDGSLSVAGLTLLGAHETATRYLEWLAGLTSTSSMPLQVAYHISGNPHLAERLRPNVNGYRDSRPVRFGNRAFNQVQPGSLGYLADCTLIYLEHGGKLTKNVWQMTERIANWILKHWTDEDSGVWELPKTAHYTSSRVMSWVTLDRAIKIAERGGFTEPVAAWCEARDQIHESVMRHGWSEKRKTFIQRYGADALDASVLLIPVMGFLPPNHPRVHDTVGRIAEELSIDGLIYRFDPLETPVEHPQPMGQYEASFLPCTFWLASSYALTGQVDEAEGVLKRAEELETSVGLFSEEADPRDNALMGNYPLLFSQVEYVRAALLIERAHGQHPKKTSADQGHAQPSQEAQKTPAHHGQQGQGQHTGEAQGQQAQDEQQRKGQSSNQSNQSNQGNQDNQGQQQGQRQPASSGSR